MKEYMFYIRNLKDAKKSMTPQKNLEFVKKCEVYIERLKSENKLISAQPLLHEGIVISKNGVQWNDRDISADSEIQVGYYHILARDFDDAIRIARQNPEFEYVPYATIEVRPVKGVESETGFVYPSANRG